MLEVKIMVGDHHLPSLISKSPDINWESYQNRIRIFGEENIGLVRLSDVLQESEYGVKAPIHLLRDDFSLVKDYEFGLDSRLFLAEGTEFGKREIPTVRNMEDIIRYLGELSRKGDIDNLVNSEEATAIEDKINFIQFIKEGFPVIPTSHFIDEISLLSYLESNPKDYILKHRWGCDGADVHLLKRDNSQREKIISGLKVDEYILQPELDIESEIRMIFFEEDFLGGRIIFDRTRPWEKEGCGRKHETSKYNPSENELNSARELFVRTGAVYGCIDLVNLRDGRNLILEYNGAGTGLGYTGGPYKLDNIVYSRLKEKFLK
jgi:glutathione synthase/RimK-type ligase-like ATP-grasp enzyme